MGDFFRPIVVSAFLFVLPPLSQAQRIMESINRGLVAVPVTGGTQVGWRLFGTDPYDAGFNVYKGATRLNATPITGATLYTDNSGGVGVYTVRPVINGQEGAVSEAARVFTTNYWTVNLQIPAGGTFHSSAYTYSAGDASVADLDGDQQYDIVLKWDPSNARDNAQDGYTGPQILDGYRLDGTRLWRINLGRNIRAGAHYLQFMVYDLDGDGRAEVVCKTAPNTSDGTGAFIRLGAAATADHNADYTNAVGKVLSGPEYLTVFDGQTGRELATTNYTPPRGTIDAWGGVGGNGGNDNSGNRVDRFLAAVAYLDGQRPSVIMCRGYYGRSVLAAWDWRNGQLTQRWVFDSQNSTHPYSGQGAHSLSVADVDADGRDEIIYGSMTVDDNGQGLYNTGLRHGDALHVSDFDPARPGLEVYMIHENEGAATSSPGSALRNARTGQIYWQTAIGADVGRGVAADVTAAGTQGAEFWGTGTMYTVNMGNAGASPGSTNFLAWWDGDLSRELEDGTAITKVGGGTLLTASGCASNNGTKSTPAITADLFGDWREEVMWRTSNNQQLRIYTTTTPTTYRFYTLMHNPAYRMAVAWQNVGYNQPPHVDYYLGNGMIFPPPRPNIVTGPVTSVYRETQGLAQLSGGHILRFAGGERVILPNGYRGADQVVTLRDAFGRIRLRGVPDNGSLFARGLPGGVYYVQTIRGSKVPPPGWP